MFRSPVEVEVDISCGICNQEMKHPAKIIGSEKIGDFEPDDYWKVLIEGRKSVDDYHTVPKSSLYMNADGTYFIKWKQKYGDGFHKLTSTCWICSIRTPEQQCT